MSGVPYDVAGPEDLGDLVGGPDFCSQGGAVQTHLIKPPKPHNPLEAVPLHLPGTPQGAQAVLTALFEKKEFPETRIRVGH